MRLLGLGISALRVWRRPRLNQRPFSTSSSSHTFNSLEHAPHRAVVKSHARTVLEDMDMLLRSLTDSQYCATSSPEFFHATVGSHTRHICDHFMRVLSVPAACAPARIALAAATPGPRPRPGPVLKYEERSRGTAVETDRTAGLQAVVALRALLEGLALGQGDHWIQPVQVAFAADATGTEYTLPSTLERELAFVAHHATHHLASVRGILAQAGVRAKACVGLANSTRAHLERQAQGER